MRHALPILGLVATAALAASTALAGGNIGMIVLKEHAVGSTTTAQPYLDKLMGIAAKENGWESGGGSFQTSRSGAEAWIAAEKPHYGIISLAAFLAFQGKY